MTPTPPIAHSEPATEEAVNETASSSSASSASSQCQSEQTNELKQKNQVSSSDSSVTALNSELTTLTAINQSEKDSIMFSSSSSASSNSSKSASSSNLNKSNENKQEAQGLDSNNNKNLDQKIFRKQPDSFRITNTQNQKTSSFPRVNYQKNNRNFQTEPLTVQTSNSRSQSQMTSPFYYGNHSNPISPVKNSRQNTKQNLPRNYKNSEMLKINTNMNASNYVGSVIGAVYPDTKSNGPFSSGSKNYNQNSQSQSCVPNAAETVASYANQTASVSSSIIPNTSRPSSYPNELKQNQSAVQAPQQYMYPNFYYYTNPAALPINQNGIFIDPNLQRSNQMHRPATPLNPYYQTQTSNGSNPDSQKQNMNANSSQSTILNAFETATNNPNQISTEQLDEMMQKNLNISQYESQQYTGPVYYLAQVPNSQYYAYYYAPSGTILGPSPGQSQVQIIAPIPNQNSTSSQMNQSYQNQPNFAPQQQFMSQMYMQHQMMGSHFVQPNSQPMPFLQVPAISYMNSGQPNMPQNGQQIQYQHTTQTSPKQNFPTSMQMYQYGSAITPKGANMMSSSISQNRSTQNSQKSNYNCSDPIE